MLSSIRPIHHRDTSLVCYARNRWTCVEHKEDKISPEVMRDEFPPILSSNTFFGDM